MGHPWGTVLRGVLALLWGIFLPLLARNASFQEWLSTRVHSNVRFYVSPLPFPITLLVSPRVCPIPDGCCSFLNTSELVYCGGRFTLGWSFGSQRPAQTCVRLGLGPSGTRTGNFLVSSAQVTPEAPCPLNPCHSCPNQGLVIPFFPPTLLFYFSSPMGNRTLLSARGEIFVRLSQEWRNTLLTINIIRRKKKKVSDLG